MAQFRILSLDGGGAWALIQVKTLIDLFSRKGDGTDVTGHDVLKKFDLAIGNSGGTITLGGLVANMTLSDLLAFFFDQNALKSIFVRNSIFQDPAAHVLRLFGIGPKYDAAAKLKGLKGVLKAAGENFVHDLPGLIGSNYAGNNIDVVFCAFDYDANREVFFRSNLASLAASSGPPLQATVAIAIHASTNAPVNYFDAPAQGPNGARYWDGAIGGYNNPVLAGVLEAVANNVPPADVWALSIGTASVVLPPQRHVPNEDPVLVSAPQSSTIPNDLKKLATSIVDDPPDAASFHAHMLLGCPLPLAGATAPVTTGRVIRMNPLVQPLPGNTTTPWLPPAAISDNEFDQLVNMDMDAIKPDEILLISKLCDSWLKNGVRNQGIRVNHTTLLPDIGHALYRDAKAFWLLSCPP